MRPSFRGLPVRLGINSLLAVLLTLLLVSNDIIFNGFVPFGHFHLLTKNVAFIFLMCLTLTFFKRRLCILLFLGVFYLFAFIEHVHFSYFSTWIFPYEIIEFFKNIGEVNGDSQSYSHFILIPALNNLVDFGLSVVLVFVCKKRFSCRWSGLITTLILCAVPYNILAHNSDQGLYQNSSSGSFVNVYTGLSYFIVRTLPETIFGSEKNLQPVGKPLAVTDSHPKVNVILVMGESLTLKHMSLYGYPRKTTPYLDSLRGKPAVMIKKGVSGAVLTEVSLPSFFNMVYRPNSVLQISEETRNLFRMAHKNGFYTAYISAQAADQLEYIKAYLGLHYLDFYDDASYFGKPYNVSAHDIHLVRFLKRFQSKGKPFFLVLHQRGSHSPYNERYPASFDFYKSNKHTGYRMTQVNSYDNSVRYTDDVLKKIIAVAKKKFTRPTYVIFTSDHGESLGKNNIYGHGNYHVPQQYEVPIVVVGLHGANMSVFTANRHAINPSWLSHYELSKLIANLLGYSIYPFNQRSGYYVNGINLRGTAGFKTIKDVRSLH